MPRARRRRASRRRALSAALAMVVLVAVAIAVRQHAGGAQSASEQGGRRTVPRELDILIGPRRTRIDLTPALLGGAIDPRRLESLLGRLPPSWKVVDRGATVYYALSLARAMNAVLTSDRDVAVVRTRPRASVIGAPVVAQVLRNGCEATALQILLASAGADVTQQKIQDAFPTSGPLDPVGEGPTRVWGDPDLGFVGRPAGGGTAGGFGVYQGPVRATARRFGLTLDDLTGRPAGDVVRRVAAGRAVLVWIGLAAGPYGSWVSPAGRPIRVNFNEHTVVLAGVTARGRLRVVNPLRGTVEYWTVSRFTSAWALLGHRALAVPL